MGIFQRSPSLIHLFQKNYLMVEARSCDEINGWQMLGLCPPPLTKKEGICNLF